MSTWRLSNFSTFVSAIEMHVPRDASSLLLPGRCQADARCTTGNGDDFWQEGTHAKIYNVLEDYLRRNHSLLLLLLNGVTKFTDRSQHTRRRSNITDLSIVSIPSIWCLLLVCADNGSDGRHGGLPTRFAHCGRVVHTSIHSLDRSCVYALWRQLRPVRSTMVHPGGKRVGGL